jgi:predicted transcriptional regulator
MARGNHTRDALNQLGRRERQIMSVVFRLGRASVGDVLARLEDPPSYSSVRTMLRYLESKGYLRHEQEGRTYVYIPTIEAGKAQSSALGHLVQTFFGGSRVRAVAALLDDSDVALSAADLKRLRALIANAQAKESG